MKPAWYMAFRKRLPGDQDFIGGSPNVVPSDYPWPREDDKAIGFLAQFRIDERRLAVPNAAWLQLYQVVEEGDDPTPFVVVVGEKCDEPSDRRLAAHPAHELGIDFSDATDPDVLPQSPTSDDGRYFLSKLGGTHPWGLEEGVFLGQLHEAASGLNFGGRACGLYLQPDGSVIAVLR